MVIAIRHLAVYFFFLFGVRGTAIQLLLFAHEASAGPVQYYTPGTEPL